MSILKDSSARPPHDADKETIKAKTEEVVAQLREKQKVLYAQGEYSVLVIMQGLDASGKDGAINDVFSGLNLLGVQVTAFKAPTEEERRHDFLWRVHQRVPGKGSIGIFNRSHYEDVLVPRVEGWIDHKAVKKRFQHINDFEALLAEHNTAIVKFYLNVSAEEQHKRLTERTENPKKYWKHDDNDWQVAAKREDYLEAYEAIFKHCSEVAPWHIVPADKNWYKTYIIASKTLEVLENMSLTYPELK